MSGISYLPEEYCQRMRTVLGAEYDAYMESFEQLSVHSLRANTLKIEANDLAGRLGLTEQVPWVEEGYYYSEDIRYSRHPYYYAGLYYLQEASAMTPGSVLPVEPGDRVLDLCGAPGGKSTQLGMRLKGHGVLYANDISTSRAQAMLKNIELAGIPNVYVTAENPKKLAARFGEWFDKILVDAPCSGEGMFRREPSMVKDWEEKGPAYYAEIQKEILEHAVHMLRPGGMLLFSTCTFSEEEDEESVRYILEHFPEMDVEPIPMRAGFSEAGIPGTIKLWPHKVRGEGHFVALLKKNGEEQCSISDKKKRSAGIPSELMKTDFPLFADSIKDFLSHGQVQVVKDQIYLLPEGTGIQSGIRYLRTGLLLGSLQKGRFTPSQALAMALTKDDYPDRVDFPLEDDRVIRYLKGETVTCDPENTYGKDGWCLICVDGFPLGWSKRIQTQIKNKYYPGWRWQ